MCNSNCTQGRRCACAPAANDLPPSPRPEFLEPLGPSEMVLVLGGTLAGVVIVGAGLYTVVVWLIGRFTA